MGLNGILSPGLLDDWIIVLGGRLLVGRVSEERPNTLQPVYDLQAGIVANGRQIGSVLNVAPLLGMTIDKLEIDALATRIYCRDLSRETQKRLSAAIRDADGLLQAMRAQDAGVTIVSKLPEIRGK